MAAFCLWRRQLTSSVREPLLLRPHPQGPTSLLAGQGTPTWGRPRRGEPESVARGSRVRDQVDGTTSRWAGAVTEGEYLDTLEEVRRARGLGIVVCGRPDDAAQVHDMTAGALRKAMLYTRRQISPVVRSQLACFQRCSRTLQGGADSAIAALMRVTHG